MRLFARRSARGFAVGFFDSPDVAATANYRPGSRSARGVARLRLRHHRAGPPPFCGVDYNRSLQSAIATVQRAGSVTSPLFGDIFDAGIGLLLTFLR